MAVSSMVSLALKQLARDNAAFAVTAAQSPCANHCRQSSEKAAPAAFPLAWPQ